MAERGRERMGIGDLGTLVICSIRYTLGRQTYMPSEVARITRAQWADLTEQDRGIVIRDVREWLGREERRAPSCDVETWRDLLEWVGAR
jgi:hypothetical protein